MANDEEAQAGGDDNGTFEEEVEEAPKLDLQVSKKTTVAINAEIVIGKSTLRVKSQKEGIKLAHSKNVKLSYYQNRTESTYVIIPEELVDYAIEALQAVVDARRDSSE